MVLRRSRFLKLTKDLLRQSVGRTGVSVWSLKRLRRSTSIRRKVTRAVSKYNGLCDRHQMNPPTSSSVDAGKWDSNSR